MFRLRNELGMINLEIKIRSDFRCTGKRYDLCYRCTRSFRRWLSVRSPDTGINEQTADSSFKRVTKVCSQTWVPFTCYSSTEFSILTCSGSNTEISESKSFYNQVSTWNMTIHLHNEWVLSQSQLGLTCHISA